MILLSTGFELVGVALVGITIIHLLMVRWRIGFLQRASSGRADKLVQIVEDAAHKHVTMPSIGEIILIVLGLTLNLVGISIRFAHELVAVIK
jgi:hypothetical protein